MSNQNTPGATKPAPKMLAPQAMHDAAEKGTAQARETYNRMSAATTEAATGMGEALSSATRSAMDCNAKVLEFAGINATANFDYAAKLIGVRSPAELLELSTRHAREQFEVLSAQSKELAALSRKMMLEAAEPLKAGAAKMFQA